MIIPVRCFTCGKVLANKWKTYATEVEKMNMHAKDEETNTEMVPKNFEPTLKKDILDKLGLTKMCCRRHMLTHVDMIDVI